MTEATVTPAGPDDLDRRLDEPRAESYKFTSAGETLKGTVTRLEVADTSAGPCKIVVLRTDDGKLRSVWLWHDALLSQMRKLKPQPGDRVAIRYNGKQESANGRSYHSYTVVSDRDASGFSWDDEPARKDADPARSSAAAADEDPWADGTPLPPVPDEPPF